MEGSKVGRKGRRGGWREGTYLLADMGVHHVNVCLVDTVGLLGRVGGEVNRHLGKKGGQEEGRERGRKGGREGEWEGGRGRLNIEEGFGGGREGGREGWRE